MDWSSNGEALGGDCGARSFDGEGESGDSAAPRGGVEMLGGAMVVLLATLSKVGAPVAEVKGATAEL